MNHQSKREGLGLIVLSLIVLALCGVLLLAFGPDHVVPRRGPVSAWVLGGATVAVGVGAFGVVLLLRGKNR